MKTLKITLIQSDLLWEDMEGNLANFTQKLTKIPKDAQLVFLPEMFSTGFSMQAEKLAESMNGETVQWMREQSRKYKIILCGSLIIEENGNYFNRMIWMQPDGTIHTYDKRHLFSYAGENISFTAGQERKIVSVNGWRILLQICYDLRFPVFARQQKNAEYDAILYVANWPASRIDAWDTLLKARAIENQCYTIGVNRIGQDGQGIPYNGSSSVYDLYGNCLYGQKDTEDIVSLVLDPEQIAKDRAKIPFLKDADRFEILY